MAQGKYVELSVAQRGDVWRRWKAGESLHTIGRAVDRPHTSIHCLLAHHGGIVPAVRRRSLRVLSTVEREDISRGLASGSSLRDIAKRLERAVSTVSREVAGHGGGAPSRYRTSARAQIPFVRLRDLSGVGEEIHGDNGGFSRLNSRTFRRQPETAKVLCSKPVSGPAGILKLAASKGFCHPNIAVDRGRWNCQVLSIARGNGPAGPDAVHLPDLACSAR
jgi:hypothetical protein